MLSERDVCFDVVKDLKYLSFMETVLGGEASPDLKPLFLSQLQDHQQLQTQFLRLMEQRNWYPRVPGDWAYNEPYTFQGMPVQAAAFGQAATSPAWQAPQPAGGSLGGAQALQALQQNLREQR